MATMIVRIHRIPVRGEEPSDWVVAGRVLGGAVDYLNHGAHGHVGGRFPLVHHNGRAVIGDHR
jgi:hypothetical protein